MVANDENVNDNSIIHRILQLPNSSNLNFLKEMYFEVLTTILDIFNK